MIDSGWSPLPFASTIINNSLKVWKRIGIMNARGAPGRDTRIQSMRSRKKTPPAVRSKRGLQVVSGRGGSRRAPGGAGPALALQGSRDSPDEPPNRLPLLPLRSDVVFPQTVVPLVINRPSGIRLVDDVL